MIPTRALFEAVSQPFKRSAQGLFHGKMRLTGNNVPFSHQKTLRTWLPNVQKKRLWSDTLQKFVRTTVTVRALRIIKKLGGLDNYIMQTSHQLLKWEGMRIRVMIRDHLAAQAAKAAEAEKPALIKAQRKALLNEKMQPEAQLVAQLRNNKTGMVLKRPTLEECRLDRMEATAAAQLGLLGSNRGRARTIGKESLVGAKDTILYLKQFSPKLAKLNIIHKSLVA